VRWKVECHPLATGGPIRGRRAHTGPTETPNLRPPFLVRYNILCSVPTCITQLSDFTPPGLLIHSSSMRNAARVFVGRVGAQVAQYATCRRVWSIRQENLHDESTVAATPVAYLNRITGFLGDIF